MHIYVMNSDGSSQERLIAESPGTSAGTVWSPDGTQIVLSKKTDAQGADIFLYDAEGNLLRRLTEDPFHNGAPAFSPDGAQIAFHSDAGGQSEIVVMDADGSNRRTVVAGGNSWYPMRSPDGQWLVFTAQVPGDTEDNLDVLAVPFQEGGTPSQLAGGPRREAEGQWRPRRQVPEQDEPQG